MDVRFKVILGKQKGQVLQFGAGEFLIGRGYECHVRPDSPMVSRQHCLLRVLEDEVWLRDLGSANGTLVNDSLLTADKPLHHGDQIQLGPVTLEVVLPSQETEDQADQSGAENVTIQDAAGPGNTLQGK